MRRYRLRSINTIGRPAMLSIMNTILASNGPLLVLVLLSAWAPVTLCKMNHDKIGKHMNMTDKQIVEQLLAPDIYDPYMRPEVKTVVNVSLLLLSISSPDESSVTYEIGFIMVQRWYDPRLRFKVPAQLMYHAQITNQTIYLNGLNYADKMFLPDLYFTRGEFKHTSGTFDRVHIALKIYPNGTIVYATRRNMIITCEGNLRIFPFDSPKCSFGIESVSHEKDQLELRWEEEMPIRASESMKTINAYMIRNATNRCNKRHTWRREFSCLSALLVFARDQSFYMTTVFVPSMVLVTSSFISFWLDVNAVPARVMIAVTTMLNFATTTNSFRSKLPITSTLYAMNMWDFACMFFIYASMIEFIIVNYIYRRNPRHRSISRQSLSSQGGDGGGYSFRQKSIRRSNRNDLPTELPNNKDKCQPMQMKASLVNVDGDGPESNRTKLANNCAFNESDQIEHKHGDDSSDDGLWQLRNIFDWIRRPYLIQLDNGNGNVRLARNIDHISKTAFTLLFGLFSFFYFLTYAVIKPAQLDDTTEKEFEEVD